METLTGMVSGAAQATNGNAKVMHGGVPQGAASVIAQFDIAHANNLLDDVVVSHDSPLADSQNTSNNNNSNNHDNNNSISQDK